jgi:hypothetical protein
MASAAQALKKRLSRPASRRIFLLAVGAAVDLSKGTARKSPLCRMSASHPAKYLFGLKSRARITGVSR